MIKCESGKCEQNNYDPSKNAGYVYQRESRQPVSSEIDGTCVQKIPKRCFDCLYNCMAPSKRNIIQIPLISDSSNEKLCSHPLRDVCRIM